MDSKQEAKELTDKFYNINETTKVMYLGTNPYISRDYAKHCAILCVEWHLKEFISTYGDDLISNIEYWEDVKKEIELL